MSDTGFDNPPQRRPNTIVVIAVLCVAVGGVLAMRFLSPRDATAGDPEIDRRIDEILRRETEHPSAPEPVIEILLQGPIAPEGRAPRNPFVGGGSKPPPLSATPKEARRKQIEHAVGQLQLQAVMTGRQPVATVNGRAVGVGSVIRVSPGESNRPVELRVVSISPGSVTLVAEDPELDLTVEKTLSLDRP
jgi:hypothetical protein